MLRVSNGKKWQAVLSHEFDDNLADRPFSARLAEENGWTEDRANRVLLEYRRFAYLCSISENGEMTPSVDVDEAWHLHLAYTRNYWGPFAEALGRPLHHGPSPGGSSAEDHYAERYEATLEAYRREFGLPPEDVWPPASVRFSPSGQFLKLAPGLADVVRFEVDAQQRTMASGFLWALSANLVLFVGLLVSCLSGGWFGPMLALAAALPMVLVGASVIDGASITARLASGRLSFLGAPSVALLTGLLVVPPKPSSSDGGSSGSSCGSVASCGSGCGGGGGCGG